MAILLCSASGKFACDFAFAHEGTICRQIVRDPSTSLRMTPWHGNGHTYAEFNATLKAETQFHVFSFPAFQLNLSLPLL
jgi:hypothetical protein